jgi:hypothetical protein
MWAFLPGVFVSIVQHRTRPDHLLVRARRRIDLERVLEDLQEMQLAGEADEKHVDGWVQAALSAPVVELAEADYRFRIEMHREVVARLLARAVRAIDYDNFKAHPLNRKREGMLLRVWMDLRHWASGEPQLFDEDETTELLARGRR